MATAITVTCPHCGNKMRASSEYIGRQGRCPNCRELVAIQASGDPSMETIQPTVSTGPAPDAAARLSSTSVAGWLSGVIGASAAALLYLCIFLPLRNTFIGQLFIQRGPMPYFITLVTCWGLAMLVLKHLAVKKQMSYAELELELIPLEIGVQITPDNVEQFLEHLGALPVPQRYSILGRRIQGALEHFKSRNSVPEVQEYLATQSEIDSSGVDSGYTLLRAFIWAIPILGFIGTVMGISTAVSGLDAAIAPAQPAAAAPAQPGAAPAAPTSGADKLMDGLGTVTAGLATAFDTTLIALVMAILLLFPTESLRRIEYSMLDRIEAFANESLLRRMSDVRGDVSAEEMPEVVRHALDAAFQEHQRWLAQWQSQVGQLGQLVGADFEAVISRVRDQLAETETQRVQQYERLGHLLEDVFEKAKTVTETWQQQAAGSSHEFIDAVTKLQQTLSDGNLGDSMQGLADQVGKLAQRIDGSAAQTGTPTTEVLDPPAGGSGLFGRFLGRRR